MGEEGGQGVRWEMCPPPPPPPPPPPTRCKVGNVQIADVDVSYFLSYFLTQQGTLMAKVLKDGQIFSCTLMPTVEERGLH